MRVNTEKYTFDDWLEFDFVAVESSGATMFVSVVLDKESNTVSIMHLDLDQQLLYRKDDFEKLKEITSEKFYTLDEARAYFDHIRHPLKVAHLVNKYKRKGY